MSLFRPMSQPALPLMPPLWPNPNTHHHSCHGSNHNSCCFGFVFVVTALNFIIIVSSHAFNLVSNPFIAMHTSGGCDKTLIPTLVCHWSVSASGVQCGWSTRGVHLPVELEPTIQSDLMLRHVSCLHDASTDMRRTCLHHASTCHPRLLEATLR